jgi:hypothetical protein
MEFDLLGWFHSRGFVNQHGRTIGILFLDLGHNFEMQNLFGLC